MFVTLQIVEAVCSKKDVCLSLQRLAKGMASLGHHVVEDTASRKDINSAGLKGTGEFVKSQPSMHINTMTDWLLYC